MRSLYLFFFLTVSAFPLNYGIFPTPAQLGMNEPDYWYWMGNLGMLSVFIFFVGWKR